MKKLILFLAVLAFSINSYAQCTPLAPSGNPGLTPAPSAVPCIERGVPYETFLYFENFTSFSCGGFTANVVSATIDDMQNFPCGINWQADQNSYTAGETGCIRIYGTSTDAVGEYALTVEMTFTLSIFGQNYPVSGTLAQLQSQLSQFGCSAPSVNTNYFSRVIDSGNACPAIGASPARTSSGTTCPTPTLGVTISGANASPLCAGASDTLTANATNAVGNVTYAWSNSATTQSIVVSPGSNTTYSVTVTAQNGTATASASITVTQLPFASFNAIPSGMNADIYSGATTGATSYSWNFGDGQTSTAQNPLTHAYSANGTYTITLIASNGCGSDTATQQVTITGTTGPSVAIYGNATLCAGASINLTANNYNTTGNVSYAWSNGGNLSFTTVNPTVTTTYTVTMTAGNGVATDTFTVTVNQRPNAAFTATPSGLNASINNATTGATSYSWNFGDGQTSAAQNPGSHTYAGSGTYTITLIASNTCGSDTATQSVTVTGGSGPSVSIAGGTTVCTGSSTTLTANASGTTGNVTYSWNTGSSNSAITVSPANTTTYTVTVTAQNGTASSSATVTVNQKPNAAFTATPSGATATINNTTTGATSYSWNFGDGQTSTAQNPGTHTYTGNGTFTITLIATNNCGNDTATAQVTVAVTNGPSVTISGNTTVCSGASTTLTANVQNATGAVTYLWTPGNSTGQTLTVSPTTTTLYTVVVTAQNGTAGNTATVTVSSGPSASFSASLSGATVTINNATTGATSFSWNFGDGELSALQNPLDHTYTSNGTFTITLEATNGCGTTTVTETVTVVGVGIDDVVTVVGVKIYPNPFEAVATVEVENISGDFDVALYTLTGLKVQQQRMNTQKFTIEKGALSPGVYLIEVSNARVVKRSKVVIY